ncbi:MAG: type III secretion system inner rod subunit SctI [Acetobacteraceae bacterium]
MAIDVGAFAGQALQQALNQASSAPPLAKPGAVPAAENVAALENALNGQPRPHDVPPAATEEGVRIEPVDTAPGASGPSLGDRILGGLTRLNDTTRDALGKVEAAVGPGGEISPADLLKAQSALMQVSLQQDVTAKVAGKATQTLDTLLKNQ